MLEFVEVKMNKENLLHDLSRFLDVERSLINESIELNEEAYWDSLTMISTITSAKNHYGVNLSARELLSCDTIGDIFILIEQK